MAANSIVDANSTDWGKGLMFWGLTSRFLAVGSEARKLHGLLCLSNPLNRDDDAPLTVLFRVLNVITPIKHPAKCLAQSRDLAIE